MRPISSFCGQLLLLLLPWDGGESTGLHGRRGPGFWILFVTHQLRDLEQCVYILGPVCSVKGDVWTTQDYLMLQLFSPLLTPS